MPDVYLIREDEREMYFAFPSKTGIVFAGFGGLFAVVGWFIPDAAGRWIFVGVGLLFLAIGIAAALWRHELRFDLMARRYTRLRGFWPTPRLMEGSLDEVEGVILVQEERTSSSKHGSHTYIVWVAKLPFRGEEKPVDVHESRDEAEAYRRAESLAKKLHISLMDRTQIEERVIAPDKLDETLAQRLAAKSKGWGFATSVSGPPMGSRIVYDDTPPRRTILLPPIGYNFLTIFLVLFGLLFAAAGGFVLYAKLTGMDISENPEGAGWIIAPIFILIGAGIALLGAAISTGRDAVREEGDALLFVWSALGRDWRTKRIPKHEVEEIDIRYTAEPATGRRSRVNVGNIGVALGGGARTPNQEVVVRSDRHVARLGKGLSGEEQQWLRDALTAMVRG